MALLAAPLASAAQPARIARIGVLSGGSPGPSPLLDAFRDSLREMGYVEGKTLQIEYRFAEAKPERLRGLAAELVSRNVDVILTMNTPASQAAKSQSTTIPIVFAWVVDPLSLVPSLARPGGNITGLTTMSADLGPKRLELLKDMLPGLTKVAILWNAGNPTATRFFKDMEHAAPSLGIRVDPFGIQGSDRAVVERAVDDAARRAAGAVFVIEETMLLAHRRLILQRATANRLPTASTNREFVEAGGLASYGVNLPEMFRRAAWYVDKILRGTKPADLPVEQPTKLELIVNMKVARTLGLTIPPAVLLRADRVIE